MKSRTFKIIAVLMLVAMLSAPFSGMSAKGEAGISAAKPVKHSLAVSETGLYIIRLQDASLAAYRGGIAGLSATSPEATGARRLDSSTTDSQAYLDYLSGKQGELLDNMAQAFGHPVEAVYEYKNVLNAVAVKLDHAEALQAFNLPGVLAVYPDMVRQLETDVGPILIGAPSIWTGNTLDGSSSSGEGMIIGVIDTGINHAHPSFADVDKNGYDHTNPYGSGNYVGVCETDPAYADFCNDKLIGAYDFVDSGGPEDENGHGSHTASTAGGNFVDVVFDDGAGGTFTVGIQGVAPHANLVAYRVCDDDGGCWGSASVAAVDHAIEDMVDVLNYSISGADDPWADAVDLAFLDAFSAGIFVSASAGNAGPDPSTVAKTGPWNASVAGTTHSRIIAHTLDVVTAGDSLLGIGAVEGTGPALTADLTDDIVYGGDVDLANLEGCDAWDGTPFAGFIGMVQRGTCSFAIKVDNLAAAGAIGAIVYNNVDGPPIVMGGLETTTIPSMFITLDDGEAVADLIDEFTPATATMYVAQSFVYNEDWADIMYASSSRGPSQWELLKPDYGAPAVNILAAVAAVGDDPVQYEFYQGTSMAAPHGAGSAALLMDLHPDWSPAAIKSAIATTAYQGVVDTDGTPADPFDIGSGRIDLNEAAFAGFVLEETSANYIAANPYLGGEPNTLNQPSMVEYTCIGTCSWTRTIQSTMDVAQDWEISFDAPAEMILTASPSSFTLVAGGTQIIEITADMTAATPDVYYFGDVILTPVGDESVAVGHLPVVVKLGASNLPSQLDIRTDQLAGTVTLEDIQALYEIEDLWIDIGGLTLGQSHDLSLDQDPTNGDPYDDLNQVFWTTINVPNKTLRLIAEIAESEALDVDLYLGSGDTPSEDTEICVSASGIWAEYCNLDFPARGTYWVLVQNWQGSDDQPDAIRAITALVLDDDAGNLTVTGPETVPAMELFNLDVNWDEPSMLDGDIWYAQFSVGTERREAGNLGYVNVDLEFYIPFYAVDLVPETQDAYGDPGVTVAHTLTLTNMGNVQDTYDLSFADNLWDVALSDTSVTLDRGESTDILVNVTVPADALADAMDMATIVATSTTDPMLSVNAVVNTYANAVYAVDLSPETQDAYGDPGVTVAYTLTLSNMGNVPDTYDLALADNLWEVTLSETSLALAVGESADIQVNVTVPADALADAMDMATIVATSTTDPMLSVSAVVNTYANAVYAIELTPLTDSAEDAPGTVVTYLLTLANQGNAVDTVTVAASGNLWEVNLPLDSFDVPVGGSVEVTVEVTIPADAMDGESDMVTITATSEGGMESSSNLTTSASTEQEVGDIIICLPLVFND
jgi:subtilisin family serine protease/CRISPR/Cas system CMR-associated protein Cmr5 small subunit